jgi:hypothetical protein
MLPHPQPDISSENAVITKQDPGSGEMDIVDVLTQDLQVAAPNISKLSQISLSIFVRKLPSLYIVENLRKQIVFNVFTGLSNVPSSMKKYI